jgi:hypothetical protein
MRVNFTGLLATAIRTVAYQLANKKCAESAKELDYWRQLATGLLRKPRPLAKR